MLAAVGLGELAADTVDEFEAIVVRLCRNVEYLDAMRQGMRDRLGQSPLFDAQRFAQTFIPVLRDIVERPPAMAGQHTGV